MKIKHFQGYGCVTVTRVKDSSCTLHVKVSGNHECGLYRNDEYDLFNWLVKRFDKSIADSLEWHRRQPKIVIEEGYENGVETCDYMFTY